VRVASGAERPDRALPDARLLFLALLIFLVPLPLLSRLHGFASGPMEREFVELWLSKKVQAAEPAPSV
jgi:hypothetical protein